MWNIGFVALFQNSYEMKHVIFTYYKLFTCYLNATIYVSEDIVHVRINPDLYPDNEFA